MRNRITNHRDSQLESATPKEFRSIVRKDEWTASTYGVCRGYTKANLAIVPKEYAFDFLLFCHRNPQPCPVLDVTEPGSPHPPLVAPDADLRTDLPRYRVHKDGHCIDEPTDIKDYWRDDLVAFLIGCSGTFDWALQASNIHYRNIGAYTTSIRCIPAGPFRGNIVVTCRLFESAHDAVRAIQISSRYLLFHGAPVHMGDPAAIGIKDLSQPDREFFSEQIAPQRPGEVAMFWGCGATLQHVAVEANLPLMITHYPMRMFITDKLSEELATM